MLFLNRSVFLEQDKKKKDPVMIHHILHVQDLFSTSFSSQIQML